MRQILIINFNLLYKFYCGNFDEFCRNIINIIFDINIYSNKIRIDFTYSFINEDIYDFRKENIKINIIHPMYDSKKCFINFNDKIYKFDIEQFNKIINNKKSFKFYIQDDYPSCKNNNNGRITLLEFLYNFKENNIIYKFKNNDKYDLRKDNVEIYHNKHNEIIKSFK